MLHPHVLVCSGLHFCPRHSGFTVLLSTAVCPSLSSAHDQLVGERSKKEHGPCGLGSVAHGWNAAQTMMMNNLNLPFFAPSTSPPMPRAHGTWHGSLVKTQTWSKIDKIKSFSQTLWVGGRESHQMGTGVSKAQNASKGRDSASRKTGSGSAPAEIGKNDVMGPILPPSLVIHLSTFRSTDSSIRRHRHGHTESKGALKYHMCALCALYNECGAERP